MVSRISSLSDFIMHGDFMGYNTVSCSICTMRLTSIRPLVHLVLGRYRILRSQLFPADQNVNRVLKVLSESEDKQRALIPCLEQSESRDRAVELKQSLGTSID